MATLSGISGFLTVDACEVIEITKWDLTYGANVEEYLSRSGGGATQTAKGATKGSGSFEVIYNDDLPITQLISEGDLVTLTLFHGANDSQTGTARVGEFSFSIDREGEMQRVGVTFTCHGSWTLQAT